MAEFRFFFPVLDETDTWISVEHAEAYRNALRALAKEFKGNNDDEYDEVRDDSYLIGRSYFGLKYRHGQKLELKVRTENNPLWMEKWSKVAFGKQSIGHYRQDIISYLQYVGYNDPSNEKLIDEPHFLTIQKKRVNGFMGNVCVEFGELCVTNEQTTFQGNIKRRHWVTVAIEGDPNSIQGFVRQHYKKQRTCDSVWNIFQLSKDIFEQNTESALNHSFIPVVSGYPLWIELLANKFTCSDAIRAEINPPLDSFLSYLNSC